MSTPPTFPVRFVEARLAAAFGWVSLSLFNSVRARDSTEASQFCIRSFGCDFARFAPIALPNMEGTTLPCRDGRNDME
jgi:hypothetical protein